MRLTEFVARRDVGDLVAETEILEPRRLADVEVIDRMQVVVEAGLGHLLGREPAAISQASFQQKDVETSFGQISAENQAMMAGTNDDPIIASFQHRGHSFTPHANDCIGLATQQARGSGRHANNSYVLCELGVWMAKELDDGAA
jgi:hypothetical protein